MPLFAFAILVLAAGIAFKLQHKPKTGAWQLTAASAQSLFQQLAPIRFAVIQSTSQGSNPLYYGGDEQAAMVVYKDAILNRKPGVVALWDRAKSTTYPVNQYGVS